MLKNLVPNIAVSLFIYYTNLYKLSYEQEKTIDPRNMINITFLRVRCAMINVKYSLYQKYRDALNHLTLLLHALVNDSLLYVLDERKQCNKISKDLPADRFVMSNI
jgi:hypothetical protein